MEIGLKWRPCWSSVPSSGHVGWGRNAFLAFVGELVASARDQEGRLALVRNQRIFVPKHVQVSWHTCRSGMVPASDFYFHLCTFWYFRKKGLVLLYIKYERPFCYLAFASLLLYKDFCNACLP